MSDRHIPLHDSGEDALFSYGDRIASGQAPPPRDALEATALRVHRALRVSAASPAAMPASLKATIWEDIMRSTTSAAKPAPSNPWGSMPNGDSPRSRIIPRHPTRLPYRRMMWTGAANVALVLLVVLVGIATWMTASDFGSSGDDGDTATVPAVALQPSTPAAGEAPAVVSSPVTTADALTDCDLGGDIPIITDLAEDESPITTTSLYVVQYDRTSVDPRGDLKLGCEGEESVVLAENVVSVWQGPWPGTVSVQILPPGTDDLASSKPSYVSIVTGEMVTFGQSANQIHVSHADENGSPWVIGPSADDPTSLVIADLRTMEVRPFSEVAGGSAPADATVIVSKPADDGTLTVGFVHPYAANGTGGTLMTDLDAPGDLLLLGSSFDDATWLTVPESLPRISAISLSPDGSHAAVVSLGEGDVVAESYRYGVIDTSDGVEIAASAEIERMDNPFVAWIQDGSAVAYLAGSTLQTLSIDGSGEPETVFEADDQLYTLQTAWDPNVVVAATHMDHGSDARADQTARDVVYSVNVETGTVHEFAGMDVSTWAGWISDAGALVMFQWDDADAETLAYQVFDPVSGDQIGEIADAPTVRVSPRTLPTIGPKSISVSEDGHVEVIALGTQHIYSFTAGADGLAMERVASPDGLLSEAFLTANVFLSPDGAMLSLKGEEDEGRVRYLLSLDDPEAEWLAIPNNVVGEGGRGLITFVDGASD
ncbi:MAG: hypothetical protein ACRDJH_03610 [Thermomicrobiales bacterium]